MPLDCKGVSLIELILAIVVVTCVMVGLSMGFSSASVSMVQNRQQSLAVSLAQDQIAMTKSNPYDLLHTTEEDYPLAMAGNASCDCAQADYTRILSATTIAASSTTFTAATCVSFVQYGTWLPQCTGDTGYKKTMVQVWWSQGNQSGTVTQQSMLLRS